MKEIEIKLIVPKKKSPAADDGKAWLKVPGCRKVAVNKSEMDAVVDKYRELGIRATSESLISQITNGYRDMPIKERRASFTGEKVAALWDRFKEAVFRHTPEEITDLLGFDPLAALGPCPRSRREK
jgi:hypothetical protein